MRPHASVRGVERALRQAEATVEVPQIHAHAQKLWVMIGRRDGWMGRMRGCQLGTRQTLRPLSKDVYQLRPYPVSSRAPACDDRSVEGARSHDDSASRSLTDIEFDGVPVLGPVQQREEDSKLSWADLMSRVASHRSLQEISVFVTALFDIRRSCLQRNLPVTQAALELLPHAKRRPKAGSPGIGRMTR